MDSFKSISSEEQREINGFEEEREMDDSQQLTLDIAEASGTAEGPSTPSGFDLQGGSFLDALPNKITILLIYRLMAARHFEDKAFGTLAWKFLYRTMLLLAFVSFLVCTVMLGVYLHLHPVTPDIRLLELTMNTMSVGEVDDATRLLQQQSGKYYGYIFSYEFVIVYDVANRNSRLDFEVDSVEVSLLYAGFPLGTTTSPSFCVPRNDNKSFGETLVREDMDVPLTVGYNMYHKMLTVTPFVFVVNLELYGRMSTVGTIQSPPFYARTRCEIDLHNDWDVGPVCERVNHI